MVHLKAFLKSTAVCTEVALEEAMKYFSPITLKKGDFFIKRDVVCKHIAFVEKGMLRVFYLNDEAEEITSCFCTKHQLTTAYKSFVLQTPPNLSIQAIEDSELLVIDYDHLQKLYATSSVWQGIGRTIMEREYLKMEAYASVLNTETAKKKYLRLLREQPEVAQRAEVQHIATYLGVSRRTLSRIRKELATSKM
jgi:CRP-like cAMP-binding protein